MLHREGAFGTNTHNAEATSLSSTLPRKFYLENRYAQTHLKLSHPNRTVNEMGCCTPTVT